MNIPQRRFLDSCGTNSATCFLTSFITWITSNFCSIFINFLDLFPPTLSYHYQDALTFSTHYYGIILKDNNETKYKMHKNISVRQHKNVTRKYCIDSFLILSYSINSRCTVEAVQLGQILSSPFAFLLLSPTPYSTCPSTLPQYQPPHNMH
jgi:hypothetical protein